jgi:hypothetical protein
MLKYDHCTTQLLSKLHGLKSLRYHQETWSATINKLAAAQMDR